MVKIAGDPGRLRPHVKTYKMAEVVRAQMARGIEKFKCATIAEAEMVAGCDVRDLLLAYQPVGPKIQRLLALCEKFPNTAFSAVVDNPEVMAGIASTFDKAGRSLPLFIDVNPGMNRTGIEPGGGALALYRALVETPGVEAAGLHVYDGHIRDRDLDERRARVEADWGGVWTLVDDIKTSGLPEPVIVAGGTPSFPIHAKRDAQALQLSPGTILLWDRGYGTGLPELPFESAAVLFTRVVSKPAAGTITLDLGTKAVASEMQPPRAWFPDFPDAKQVGHNEEHMVLELDGAQDLPVGSCLYAIPWHICPTVALQGEVTVVQDGEATGTWTVAARNRRLTI
jgi:D-serine deaminase-like pyridoxal phosphate-dependent protein